MSTLITHVTEDDSFVAFFLKADKAAIKAMLVNRVGDFGLAPGISGCFTLFQTVDFSTIFACASAPRNSWISCNMRLNAITLICILLLIGAVGKSAQIGSHTWSPDAMECPTPVSALIHAATMVTAGVFMIARCSPLFEYQPTALFVITFVGVMMSFLAAVGMGDQKPIGLVVFHSTILLFYMVNMSCAYEDYILDMESGGCVVRHGHHKPYPIQSERTGLQKSIPGYDREFSYALRDGLDSKDFGQAIDRSGIGFLD
ncbi:NADH-ubiquinone oxidoreductase chain 5 [Sesamum angolense]|uniref:NADH-ubiquinone oxidoreductase chain 5 n=1 Tax=Sesamum angolense TaxID=2727404 RepID=A0AAE2BQX2_9LAMI|nr:NADH-ubiquinone oxidoreductase chain 5 [Sesamum angolense]